MPSKVVTTFAADGLTWTDASLWQQFNAAHEASPDALALVEADGRCWSRAELHLAATEIAQELQRSGVRAHDRIMLEGTKTAPTIAAALAISCVGAVICPFTPDLGTAERQVLEERLGHIALISGSEAQAQPIPGVRDLRLSLRRQRELRPLDDADTAAALIALLQEPPEYRRA